MASEANSASFEILLEAKEFLQPKVEAISPQVSFEYGYVVGDPEDYILLSQRGTAVQINAHTWQRLVFVTIRCVRPPTERLAQLVSVVEELAGYVKGVRGQAQNLRYYLENSSTDRDPGNKEVLQTTVAIRCRYTDMAALLR